MLGLLVDARVAGDQGAGGQRGAAAGGSGDRRDATYLTGVARWESRLIMLLDLEKVLLSPE